MTFPVPGGKLKSHVIRVRAAFLGVPRACPTEGHLKHVRISAFILGATLALPDNAGAAITFTPGHVYGTNYDVTSIVEYDGTGAIVGTATAPGETRGLAFGDDGLLYVTLLQDAPITGFTVRALDASMNTVHTYTHPTQYMHGNVTYGRLALDANYLYVAGGGNLHRFSRASPAAPSVSIYSGNQVHDVEVLPNGNLLVLEAYEVREITPSGTVLREINYGFTDNRSVEYDPATNSVFVSHHGNTGTTTELMRFDYATFALTGESTAMANDLFVMADGNLLLSSDRDAGGPRVFTPDLVPLDTFDGPFRVFVTQLVQPVPEPTALAPLALAAVALLRRRSRSR
jgi:hypothetical protein